MLTVVPSPEDPERVRDAALFQRIATGDALAFRELSRLHLTMIVTYCARMLGNQADAEDVAQDAFVRVWQKAETYQPRARARTWLLAIAHNLALDRLRQQKTRREADEAEDLHAPSSEQPVGLLLLKQTSLDVAQALDRLPERQKTALLLCHEQGLSGAEIAEVLGASPDAVESLLARGRRTLRTLLSAQRSDD